MHLESEADEALLSHAEQVRRQTEFVDQHLSRPARWRGELRRERGGWGKKSDAHRYANAFDFFVAGAGVGGEPMDMAVLCTMHDEAVGGADFRRESICVGRHSHIYPSPDDVPALLDWLFADLADIQVPELAAAKVHYGILRIHPFDDGNGRTARLAASVLLSRAGRRSTLSTAIEEFTPSTPYGYTGLLDLLDTGAICARGCLSGLLEAMRRSSHALAWFRARKSRLRTNLEKLGVEYDDLESAVSHFDRGAWSATGDTLYRELVRAGEVPWRDLDRQLKPSDRASLVRQLRRVKQEEREETLRG